MLKIQKTVPALLAGAFLLPAFTARYSCKMLVWYELHSTMENAIVREKQLKAGSRKKKLALIEKTNPAWRDLYDELI